MGEGARVQPAWLFEFLRHPEDPNGGDRNMLRFWMSTRMPTFPLTQHELNALVQGFAAQDRASFPFEFQQVGDLGDELDTARIAFEKADCLKCHTTPTSVAAGRKPSGFAPDLAYARTRLRYPWVVRWFDTPSEIMPGTKMPSVWPQDPNANPEMHRFGKDPHAQMRKVADYIWTIGKPEGKPPAK